MKMMKKVCALVCSLVMLLSMAATCGLTASAYTGGGMAGTSGIKAYGCDLSYYNVGSDDLNYSYINFAKMYADGCKFTILRIGYEASASRNNTMDKAFLKLYQKAREEAPDMKLGVYFYSLGYSYDAAVEDANWVMNVIENNNMYFEYPIYYDVEDPGNGTSSRPGHDSLTSSQLTSLCLGWAETLAARNYFSGVYGIGSTMDKLTSSYTNYYDVWFAKVKIDGHGTQYDPTQYDYSAKCGMWQYAWYDCNFDGVSLDFMDANVAYKDYAAIIEPQGLNRCVTGHQVQFDANGGTDVASQSVTDGGTVSVPTAPTKYGFDFGGWYCNPELTDAYDFNAAVSYGFTLYAKWNEAYWGAMSSLMPTESGLNLVDFNDAGEQIWPYFGATDGTVTLYNGVKDDWSWPTAYMNYENSVDSTNDAYIYVEKDGTAQFNLSITYMDATGTTHDALLSEIDGKGTTDYAAGYQSFFVNFGQYVYNQGHLTASGNIKILKCVYFVIGGPDSYVKLYDLKFTPQFDSPTPYQTLFNSNSITQSGHAGSYTYDNGVLQMNTTGTTGYSLTFPVNATVNPTQMANLLMDIKATTPFNITFELTTGTGDKRMEVRNEFFNNFDLTTAPATLPAGEWKVNMNLAGYYLYNGGAVTSSTIKNVIITLTGTGNLTLSALQASRIAEIVYVQDGRLDAGTLEGDIPDMLTSSVYTVGTDKVSRIKIGTTVAQARANFDQAEYLVIYNADGTVAADADVMKTKMTVAIVSDNSVIRRYQVAVTGDIAGTGSMATSNARDLLVSIAGNKYGEALIMLAADYNGDGNFDTADVRKMVFDIAHSV